jgi:multiple sugar transport system substrate-binding protein
LQSSDLTPDPKFAKFIEIYQNPGTSSLPVTASGSAGTDLLTTYLDKWQAGSGGDLQSSLVKVDKAIDDQLAQSDGGAP